MVRAEKSHTEQEKNRHEPILWSDMSWPVFMSHVHEICRLRGLLLPAEPDWDEHWSQHHLIWWIVKTPLFWTAANLSIEKKTPNKLLKTVRLKDNNRTIQKWSHLFKLLVNIPYEKSAMVRTEGLEPTQLSPREPKSRVSTNFTTSALVYHIFNVLL